MATQSAPPIQPAPPRPQEVWTFAYANQLTRWLTALAEQASGPSYLRASGLYMPNLAPTGYGLKPGEVFENGGVLTVVREDDIWIGTLSVTGGVGTVTVTP